MASSVPLASLTDAVLTSPREIEKMVRWGRDLRGRTVSPGALLSVLRTSSPSGRWTVKNAVLPDLRITGARYDSEVRFVRCRFTGPTQIRNCSFSYPLMMKQSRFEHGLSITGCVFEGGASDLILYSVSINGDFGIEKCRLHHGPMLRVVDFRQNCKIDSVDLDADADMARLFWRIDRCQFRGTTTLTFPPHLDRRDLQLEFADCRFADTCCARIVAHGAPLQCDFYRSRIAGRLVIVAEVTGQSDQSGHVIELRECVVTGEVDLHEMSLETLEWFDLPRTSLVGGRLWIDDRGLSKHLAKDRWKLFGVSPADQCGKLKAEQELLKKVLRPPDEIKQVADQYEQLRNSFAAVPGTDREEDFCHYKCMDYRHQARIAERNRELVGRATNSTDSDAGFNGLAVALNPPFQFMATITSVMLLGIAFLSIFLPPDPVAAGAALGVFCAPGCLLLWGHCSAGGLSPGQYVRVLPELPVLVLEEFVLKRMIGYGVYVTRILKSAIGVILAFAFVYGLFVFGNPQRGTICDSSNKHKSILCWGLDTENAASTQSTSSESGDSKQQENQQVSVCCAMVRLVYFSAVTFTTLGYGDYHPTGWLRVVAAFEALLGGITLALVTVVLARRFMRR